MSSYNRPLLISELIQHQHSALTKIYNTSLTLCQLDTELKKIIDPSLKDHFELATINDDVVVLIAHSSAWASRLRYDIPNILNAFNKRLNFNTVKTIKIKVRK